MRDELGFAPGEISIRDTLEMLSATRGSKRIDTDTSATDRKRYAKTCPRCAGDVGGRGDGLYCATCCAERPGHVDDVATSLAPTRSERLVHEHEDQHGESDTAPAAPVHTTRVSNELWPPDEIDWDLPDGGRVELLRTPTGAVRKRRQVTAVTRETASGVRAGRSNVEIAERAGVSASAIAQARARLIKDPSAERRKELQRALNTSARRRTRAQKKMIAESAHVRPLAKEQR